MPGIDARKFNAAPAWATLIILLSAIMARGAEPAPALNPIRGPQFQKQILTDQYFCDGITAGDINRDGKMDIVAGPFWYEGPAFTNTHELYPARPFPTEPAPTDSMFSFVDDFNSDGWPDILALGRVHLHEAFWYENPQGKPGLWKKHFAFERIKGESPPFQDVDGDGKPELVAHDGTRWGLIQPDWKTPTNAWRFKPITATGQFHHFYHGEGIGDVNGDGRLDLVLNEGWYEQPAGGDGEWTRHEFRFGEKGGAQIFVTDVDGDGDNDVITAIDAHGWGLAWFEQVKENGEIRFKKHVIMGTRDEEAKYGVAFSQPHALALADMDGDGLLDLVVGKRRWAHGPKGDVEPMAEPVLYWFRLIRDGVNTRFEPHLIDRESGVGVQVTAADVNRDGRPDVLTVSKLGAFVFLNQTPVAKSTGAVVFPGKTWESREPGRVGMDGGKLDEFAAKVGGDGCIIKDGYLVKGWGKIRSHKWWASASKPVLSTLLLFAVQERKLHGVDALVKSVGWELSPKDSSMTFRHLANMVSGYGCVEPPGVAWGYNDPGIQLYALSLEKVFQQPLESAFKERMAALEFEDGDFFGYRQGLSIVASPLDFARVGWFWLNRGQWNGESILAGEYFTRFIKPGVPADLSRTKGRSEEYLGLGSFGGGTDQTKFGPGVYGFNFWFNELLLSGERVWPAAPTDTYQANGMWNRDTVTVIPSLRMVIAVRGANKTAFEPGKPDGEYNQNLKLIVDAARPTVFPAKEWQETTPESQGVDASKLQEAVALLDKTVGKDGVHELMIVRHGRVIWRGDDIDKVHGVWSFTKSFTSTTLGLLIDDGKCNLDTKAKDILPVLAAAYPEVTLRHFATMTSGYRAVNDEPRGTYAHGPSQTPFLPHPEPLFAPPGSKFAYWDSAMNELANLLTHVAGESLEELFRRRIADPIGMNRANWDWGDLGAVDGIAVNGGSGNNGGSMKISARETARFGLLFLNRGKWNGEQLISSRWVDEATKVQVSASVPHGFAARNSEGPGEYGFNWWINGVQPDGQREYPGAPNDTYCGAGFNNNRCFIIPKWNMVIVRLGLDGNSKDKVWSDFLAKVGEAILF